MQQDTICTLGLQTTAGSHVLEGYRPPFDATCVQKLRAAGAAIVGKTNCDQFAMGSTSETSSFPVTSISQISLLLLLCAEIECNPLNGLESTLS